MQTIAPRGAGLIDKNPVDFKFVPTSQEMTESIVVSNDQQFTSHAPGYWPDVPAELWNDWKWQLKNASDQGVAQLYRVDTAIQ